ncbi:MAG: ATP phosphoribosyltransferase regulatory subunit [Caldilineaceae bacterium]|nr:ATP phosphoribosyltransferase regulatory subunit [Caldilineaceae bacterium]
MTADGWTSDPVSFQASASTIAGQIPGGVADYFWAEAYERRELEHLLLQSFRTWGYADVITPAFEYADTLSGRGGRELRQEMCRFLDRDGSMLALRVDMTIPVARLVGTRLHDAPLPQRFCYAGNVFRDVEPRAGQQREFWQAGVELVGSATPDADAEILALTVRALEMAGLADFRLVVGQIQYFDGLINALQLSPAARDQLMQAIDRNSEAELEAFLAATPLPSRQRRALVELPRLSGQNIADILLRAERLCLNERMRAAVVTLRAICHALDAFGVLDRISLDLTEIHNLGYYTGITFEVLAPGVGYRIASGGRYDDLVGTFGPSLPAVGVAFGLERLLLARRARTTALSAKPRPLPPDILASTSNSPEAMAVVEQGRRLGLRIAVDLDHRHGAELSAAARALGISATLDWSAGGVQIARIEDGTERLEQIAPAHVVAALAQLASENQPVAPAHQETATA